MLSSLLLSPGHSSAGVLYVDSWLAFDIFCFLSLQALSAFTCDDHDTRGQVQCYKVQGTECRGRLGERLGAGAFEVPSYSSSSTST